MEQGQNLNISENAAKRITAIAEKDGKPNLMLRITVSGGGCSGFQYGFDFEEEPKPDDLVFEQHGVKVVTDPVSFDFLKGAELDYIEEMVGAYFSLRNPNAASSCGCGNSFTPDLS